jgi:hypothetical protein
MHPEMVGELERLLGAQERPPVSLLLAKLSELATRRGLRVPARATIYYAMQRAPSRTYSISQLTDEVQSALYNLDPKGNVPGHQLAFYCLNYGGLRAMSFAAGLPWLALYQAARLPGWRARSRGVLDAILLARRITR